MKRKIRIVAALTYGLIFLSSISGVAQNKLKSCPRNMNNTIKISFSDGSGNVFVIYDRNVSYDPMTPERSSSGVYSGGEPWSLVIDDAQYQELVSVVNKALKDKKEHIDSRLMGSASIRLLDVPTSAEKTCILRPSSPYIDEIIAAFTNLRY